MIYKINDFQNFIDLQKGFPSLGGGFDSRIPLTDYEI